MIYGMFNVLCCDLQDSLLKVFVKVSYCFSLVLIFAI